MRKTFLMFAIFLVLSGCSGPTIRQIPEAEVTKEEVRVAKEEGRLQGYKEAITVARAEAEDRLVKFMKQYKSELLYIEAVKAGILKPGRVEMVYSPGTVSNDGMTYAAPGFSWRVMSPPQFMADETTKWWKRDEANFCYFFISSYTGEKEAIRAVGTMEKPGGVLLTTMPYADGQSWAVIAKTAKPVCDDTMVFFQNKGLSPIKVK